MSIMRSGHVIQAYSESGSAYFAAVFALLWVMDYVQSQVPVRKDHLSLGCQWLGCVS